MSESNEMWVTVQGLPYDEQKCQEVADQLREIGKRLHDSLWLDASSRIEQCIEQAREINRQAGSKE